MTDQLDTSTRDVGPAAPVRSPAEQPTARFPEAPGGRPATEPIVMTSTRTTVRPASTPRRRGPAVVTAAVLAAALVVVGAASYVAQRPETVPVAAPPVAPVGLRRTTSTPDAGEPAPGTTGGAPIQIEVSSAEGTAVLSVPAHRWTTVGQASGASRLMVQVSLTGRTGALGYDPNLLKVFDDRGRLYPNALSPGSSGELGSGKLGPGDSTTGWVGFDVPRGATTLVLSSWRGESVAAVRIPA